MFHEVLTLILEKIEIYLYNHQSTLNKLKKQQKLFLYLPLTIQHSSLRHFYLSRRYLHTFYFICYYFLPIITTIIKIYRYKKLHFTKYSIIRFTKYKNEFKNPENLLIFLLGYQQGTGYF